MFAQDRDLLAMEPQVFRDVGWSSQRLVKGVGDVSGTMLTLTSQDVDFAAAGVGAGHVVVVDGVAYEVVERLSATTATISRVRVDSQGTVIPPSPVTGKVVVIGTFAPQIALVHAQILRLLGIEPGTPPDGRVGETAITNPADLRDAEALGALHLVYAAAAGPTTAENAGSSGATWWTRAQDLKDRYGEVLRGTGARVDLDGDGVADATRRASVLQFIRD